MTPAPCQPPDRLPVIAQARRALLDEARAAGTEDAIETWIASSWQRCLARGQRPHDAVGFDLVSRSALRSSADTNRALGQAARPVLADLDRAIAPTRYFSLLTDARGIVVSVGATADAAVPAVHAIARPGVDLSEHSVGTTAISAALGERHPVWLHRGEHFFEATSVYSCAGAPIFGPDGQLAGMLDVTGVLADERPALRHLTAQMAQRIEAGLLLALPRRHLLRVQWPGADTPAGAGLLAVDAEGQIVGADRAARAMLSLRWAGPGQRFGPLDACFATPVGRLLGLRGDGPALAVPLWSGLHALVASVDAPAGPGQPARWREAETRLIRDAIDAAHGNVARAAQQLGISRATMYRRLAALRRR
ncbi:MAG TPA: helix-turn-helix domain-containing protein [Burkholderiaceae bacterium]|nr:helix-turn-helix domain-containing protein [Burkholderiaceae bacterium]